MLPDVLPQQGASLPRLSPAEVRRVEADLARTSEEVAALSRGALLAVGPVLAQAQRETVADLTRWLAKADGGARYTTHVHRTVLAHLERSFGAIRRLDPDMAAALERAGADAGRLAGRHLVYEVARYSQLFDQAPTVLPINVARIVATGERELIPRFRTSAARYAGDVAADIRRELAVGVVRRESVSALVDRLQRLGGPRGDVALRGVAGEPGAVVEHIAEGLFRRYRYWAERVVRTETQRAYNVQLEDGIRDARSFLPDLTRRWDASADLRLCAVCAALHGTLADLGKPFPGGHDTAPAHPNCRCRVGAWRREWQDILDEADGKVRPVRAPRPRAPRVAPPVPGPAPPAPVVPPLPPLPPPPPLPVVPPVVAPPVAPPPAFAKVAQAEQWARASYPHIAWDLSGFHVDAAREVLTEFHRLAQAWPEVTRRLRFFGTYKAAARHGFAHTWKRNVYAHASVDGTRLGFNPAWFGKPAKMRAALAHDVRTGFHPPGADDIASVLTHEWGHQVDHYLQTRALDAVVPGAPTSRAVPTLAGLLSSFRRMNTATAALSRYALKNEAEGFAEAFASLRYTPAARQTEFTRRLGALLEIARGTVYDLTRLPAWDTLAPGDQAAALARIDEIRNALGLP